MSLLTDLLKALLPGLIPKKAPYCLWVLTVKHVTGAIVKNRLNATGEIRIVYFYN